VWLWAGCRFHLYAKGIAPTPVPASATTVSTCSPVRRYYVAASRTARRHQWAPRQRSGRPQSPSVSVGGGVPRPLFRQVHLVSQVELAGAPRPATAPRVYGLWLLLPRAKQPGRSTCVAHWGSGARHRQGAMGARAFACDAALACSRHGIRISSTGRSRYST